jgi:hypothetical protein
MRVTDICGPAFPADQCPSLIGLQVLYPKITLLGGSVFSAMQDHEKMNPTLSF